jgi:hypothetical protein
MQLTLNIPDNKMAFFMELIGNLGFVKMEAATGLAGLTQRQKELVDVEARRANENPGYMLDFEEAWQTLKAD